MIRQCLPERTLLLGSAVLLDMAVGEPATRWHPVGWLGGAAGLLERAAPSNASGARLAYGAALAGMNVASIAFAGNALSRGLGRMPLWVRFPLATVVLKLTFSLRDLSGSAARIGRLLEAGALPEARLALQALVSRPSENLDAEGIASAAIESLAENLSDSFTAPVFYYLLLGPPGALAYRAANTLDAMIGYHGEYEHLGKAAARLDDLLNLLPARLSALLLVAAAWLGFGDRQAAWLTLKREHAHTESPNAGWPMSAAAGALRVHLEKIGHYRLGTSFRRPRSDDLRRALRLYHAAAALGIMLALAVSMRVSPPRWAARAPFHRYCGERLGYGG